MRATIAGVRIGSLFSGYGGLDLAVQVVLGGDIAWHVEYDKAPSRILDHHFPGVPNYGDVTKLDWREVQPVDLLTGGFPCQDISSAGQKAGINGQRSGLWGHYANAIGAIRPQLVVVENVSALLVRGLDRVLADLAHLGYDARWTSLSACAAGAPFRRVRVFLIAAPTGSDGAGRQWLPQPDSVAIPDVQDGANDHEGPDAHGLAMADRRALDRWGRIIGRPYPRPGELGRNHQPRLRPAFVEWLMGLPEGWVTDPAIGLTRVQQLRALGNGVVPQQAALALDVLLQGAPNDLTQSLATV